MPAPAARAPVVVLVPLALGAIAGCGSDVPYAALRDGGTRAIDARPNGIEAPPTGLGLAPCAGAFGEAAEGLAVDCATALVPLHHDDPSGPAIELAIERVRAPIQPARAQLWMLQGGPGGSSLELARAAFLVHGHLPDVDVMLVDHRGVGLSTRLGCPTAEDPFSPSGEWVAEGEWAACLGDLAAMEPSYRDAFGTTEAARDLGDVIERARLPGVGVLVYGVSYGTYWAHRWLQLHPAQADAVVLDSICSPGECRFPIGFSRGHDEVGRELLALCGADPTCRDRMGGDPVAVARAAIDGLDAGTGCAAALDAGIDGAMARRIAAALLQDVDLRGAIPSFFHRIARCASMDAIAFRSLAELFVGAPALGSAELISFSPALYALVARSEMFDDPEPTIEEHDAAMRSFLFAMPMSAADFASWLAAPRYPIDEALGLGLAESDVPMLMMNGSLDPQTTLANATPIGQHFTGPFQHFVVIDRAPHGIIGSSRFATGSYGDTCGLALLGAFLSDPRGELDTSCRTSTARLRFDDERLASPIFGTGSLWEATPLRAIDDADARRLRARLRRLARRPAI